MDESDYKTYEENLSPKAENQKKDVIDFKETPRESGVLGVDFKKMFNN